jgi:hypothetical protein
MHEMKWKTTHPKTAIDANVAPAVSNTFIVESFQLDWDWPFGESSSAGSGWPGGPNTKLLLPILLKGAASGGAFARAVPRLRLTAVLLIAKV